MTRTKSRYARRNSRRMIRLKSAESVDEKIIQKKKELSRLAELGKKADYCMEFADEILADAENLTLDKITSASTYEEMMKIRADYIAALAFYQKIHMASQKGLLAQEKLNKMNKEEGIKNG